LQRTINNALTTAQGLTDNLVAGERVDWQRGFISSGIAAKNGVVVGGLGKL
jgi:hypothetical protein